MKYYTLHELMVTVNRHIRCNTNFASDHLLPNIHYFEHSKVTKFVNETTYNLVVHEATIAREQNAQDMDKARDQFKAVLKTIEPPMKEKIYSIPDLAMSYGAAAFNAANQWLTHHKDEFPIKEFSFNNHLGVFMTYSEFQIMLSWMREHYIYTPQKRVEKPKNEKLEKTLAQPKPRISEERITISVHGLALSVGKAEALKIAQSIMNQLGG